MGLRSDDDNFLRINPEGVGYIRNISILGFHPYKEVIFLTNSSIGVAYQLNTSMFQYLGVLRPKSSGYSMVEDVTIGAGCSEFCNRLCLRLRM